MFVNVLLGWIQTCKRCLTMFRVVSTILRDSAFLPQWSKSVDKLDFVGKAKKQAQKESTNSDYCTLRFEHCRTLPTCLLKQSRGNEPKTFCPQRLHVLLGWEQRWWRADREMSFDIRKSKGWEVAHILNDHNTEGVFEYFVCCVIFSNFDIDLNWQHSKFTVSTQI